MKREHLINEIKRKRSFLSIGLDTDPQKIPQFLREYDDPVFEFNKRIIDSTQDLCVSYKLNIAFYESLGIEGWKSLERTVRYIPDNQFLIADAKRGDIGNTSERYAETFFKTFSFDAVTVAPYMGNDSVQPFFKIKEKWVIILALTSNPGSSDFQFLQLEGGGQLYEKVLDISSKWGNIENTMFVVGATHPAQLKEIRKRIPHHFLLIPGIGKQGGSLDDVVESGMIPGGDCGLLVNSSRGIIYAGNDSNFDEEARKEALTLQQKMSELL